MNKSVKIMGPFAKVTFTHSLTQVIPGQYVLIDGKPFAIYDTSIDEFSIFVHKESYYVDNDPKEISEPMGRGFTAALCKRAIVVAGGTGIGAVVPVIRSRNKYGLSTDVLIYTKGDAVSVRADQATIGMCRNVIFWDTTVKGRPSDPLTPLVDKQPESCVFVAGPKSLVEATKKVAGNFNFICYTNF